MALNVPVGDTKRITFGPGVLYIADAHTTPDTATDDVGYARGATLAITRQKLDVFQGSPRSLVETYAVQEDVTLNFVGLEWNPTNLVRALGSGVATTGTTDKLEFGGEVTFSGNSLHFRHITPTGSTVDIYIWKGQGQGEFNINFGDDMQEFAYNFRAIESTTAWDNSPLGTDKRLLRIDFTSSP